MSTDATIDKPTHTLTILWPTNKCRKFAILHRDRTTSHLNELTTLRTAFTFKSDVTNLTSRRTNSSTFDRWNCTCQQRPTMVSMRSLILSRFEAMTQPGGVYCNRCWDFYRWRILELRGPIDDDRVISRFILTRFEQIPPVYTPEQRAQARNSG